MIVAGAVGDRDVDGHGYVSAELHADAAAHEKG